MRIRSHFILLSHVIRGDQFTALPGAGQQLAPRLLVAFGEDRSRFTSADALCRYAGIAAVTERSGNKLWVHWRYSCPRFLRQTFVEWANETIRFSFWAKAFYQLQRRGEEAAGIDDGPPTGRSIQEHQRPAKGTGRNDPLPGVPGPHCRHQPPAAEADGQGQ